MAMGLEDRVLLSGNARNPLGPIDAANPSVVLPASLMKSARPLAIGATEDPDLSAGGHDVYQIPATPNGGLLIAEVQGASSSFELRLSLFGATGELLVQSDGQSIGQQNPVIDQHVAGGATYELEVQCLAGAGSYSLSTSITPSTGPGQPVPISSSEVNYVPLAVGQFTNYRKLDIVAADGVHLGTGDGTFEAAAPGSALFDPSEQASAMAVGDFNGDGNLDVAVALPANDAVSIAMGNGDGTFQQQLETIGLPAGSDPVAIVAGNFTGTGYTDLAVADAGTNCVSILQNDGHGNFYILQTIPVGTEPVGLAAGDFEDDGRLDLAVVDIGSSDVTILSNHGDGTFLPLAPLVLPPGSSPMAIVAGKFGTGQVDLAVADSTVGTVDILLGHGDGTFELLVTINVGANPVAIVAGDFIGNGITDLATANANSDDVSVLLGNGNGTFQPAISTPTGNTPVSLVAGNFTANGHLDLATGNLDPSSGVSNISVLVGKGDGTFEQAHSTATGSGYAAIATGDFTSNGNLGVAVLDTISNSVSILPGNGDGTFQQPLTFALPAGSGASGMVAADFNGDGRLDLAIAEPALGAVQIFLGNGDGTFEDLAPISVPGASSLVAADFTDNGRIDLAVASASMSTVTILMNDGDGTFANTETMALATPFSDPVGIVAGNFGNGQVDLAVADEAAADVTVVMNDGRGNFTVQAPISLGTGFFFGLSLVAGNFTSSGFTDLAVAMNDFFTGNSIQVLLCEGPGVFVPGQTITLAGASTGGTTPVAIVTGDFTNNGITDLATADSNGNGDDYSVYLGNGDGTFEAPASFSLGGTGSSTALVTGDFRGNGQTDLAIAQTGPDNVYVQLSNGDGTFANPSVVNLVSRDTPVVTYFSGTANPGIAVVDSAGDILYRAGFPGEPGIFEQLVTVNPGEPSRDIAFVQTQFGPALASVDAFDNAISFFALRPTGFVLVAKLATGRLPAQILAADLDNSGATDLVVRNAGDGTISVYMGNGGGWFLAPINFSVGLGNSDIEVADLHNDGLMDILYTNSVSGEIGVLQNLGNGSFASPAIYQAGPGPYGVTGTDNPDAVTSLEATESVTVEAFTPGGPPSIVTLNPGSNTIGVLTGLGGGRFANETDVPIDVSGLIVRAITSANGQTELAILTPDGLSLEQSNGFGGFLPPVTIDVGFEPDGLTVANLTGSGASDLLVGNPSGEVQILVGNGDGSFQPPRNLDQQVAMAVVGPNLLRPEAFVFADDATDQLVERTAFGATIVLGDATTGLDSPGAISLADLNGDGLPDLIVANSGSNNVLIYPGLPNGTFGPAINNGKGYFSGANPAGITIYQLGPFGLPDLIIANRGSNDVTVLINTSTPGGNFSFAPGPILQAGVEPVATAVADVYGNGQSDLVIANSGSNNVTVLPPLGNGFFNDQNPSTYPVGTNPSGLYIDNFTGGIAQDIATIDSGSNTISLLANLGSASPILQSIPSGGIDPTAGFAVPSATGAAGLVVANEGDGAFALFGGSPNGLLLTSLESTPGLPNPTALAFANLGVGAVEFWAANAGEQSASLMVLGSGPTLSTAPISEAALLGSVAGNPVSLAVSIGSTIVTTISNGSSGAPLTRAISSATSSAVAATSAGLSSSSTFENFTAGNESAGVLSLFEASVAGLELTSGTGTGGLSTATSLVFAGLTGRQADMYSGTEGREAAALLALSLGVQPSSSLPSLVRLQESSLSVVGTLLPVMVESPAGNADLGLAETASAASLSSGAASGIGQSLLGQPASNNFTVSGPEPPAVRGRALARASTANPPAWMQLLVGTDEAIERFNREHPDLSTPASDRSPKTGPIGGHNSVQPPNPPSLQEEFKAINSFQNQSRTQTIDRAIEGLDGGGAGALETSVTGRVVEAHRSNANPYSFVAALASAAAVARGISVPSRGRKARMRAFLGRTLTAGWR
jgi:hypothetical protein